MMKHYKDKLLTVLVIFLMGLQGCIKSDDTNDEDAPDLPPLSSFQIDFTKFPDEPQSKPEITFHDKLLTDAPISDQVLWKIEELSLQPRAKGSNFNHAAGHVFVWKSLVNLYMFVPVITFVESFNHAPILRSDGTWVWSYTVTRATGIYKASLERSIVDNQIQWDMYISKVGEYEDFLWYRGKHNIGITEGDWTLKKAPNNDYNFIGIDWHNNTNGTSDIKYTNIIPTDSGDPQATENGGYISYGTTTNTDYDAFFDIYNKGQDNLIEIEWNLESKVGRVKNFNQFGDTDWHCWDTTLANSVCP